MCSLVLLITIFLQLVASCSKCLPSLLIFTSFLRITFSVLQKPCRGNFWKLQRSGERRSGDSGKYRYFLKIAKWQHKCVWDYKRGKLVSCILNNAAETCLHGLKMSENIEINIWNYWNFFISAAISIRALISNLLVKLMLDLFCYFRKYFIQSSNSDGCCYARKRKRHQGIASQPTLNKTEASANKNFSKSSAVVLLKCTCCKLIRMVLGIYPNEVVNSSCSQAFYKIAVLQNFQKFSRCVKYRNFT